MFFASHTFQDEANFIEIEWLRLDFSVFVSYGLIDFSGDSHRGSGAETAVLLVEISESVNVVVSLKFLNFTFRSVQDRFYVLPDELVIVDWVEFNDSQQVQQLRKF